MSRELLGTLTWLAPLPPLLSFAVIVLFTNRYRQISSAIAVVAMLTSCVLSFVVFFNAVGIGNLGEDPIRGIAYSFIPTAGSTFNIGVAVDPSAPPSCSWCRWPAR